jgi:hypothetical protein
MQYLLLKVLLISLEDDQLPELEERCKRAHGENLLPPMSVVRGLIRYLPSSRITASEALDVLGQRSFSKCKRLRR